MGNPARSSYLLAVEKEPGAKTRWQGGKELRPVGLCAMATSISLTFGIVAR